MMNKEVLRTNIKSSTKNAKDVGVLKFHIPSRVDSAVVVDSKKTTKKENVSIIKEVDSSLQTKHAPVAHVVPRVPETEINVIPFVELKCNNTHDVYRYAKSYIKDKKEKNENCFSFFSFSEKSIDLQVLTIASCYSYLENNSPILVIIDDSLTADLVKYRKGFTRGLLASMATHEWGNVTILDYQEILKKSSKERLDFKFISNEFDCVFMVQPGVKILNELKESYLDMLSFADSVSFVVDAKHATVSELNKKEKYYHSMDIRLKGILFDGENK